MPFHEAPVYTAVVSLKGKGPAEPPLSGKGQWMDVPVYATGQRGSLSKAFGPAVVGTWAAPMESSPITWRMKGVAFIIQPPKEH